MLRYSSRVGAFGTSRLRSWASLVLVFGGGWDAECLTHVFLMNPRDGAARKLTTVVALHHDGPLFAKLAYVGGRGG